MNDGLFDGLTPLQQLDLRDNPLLEVLPRSVLRWVGHGVYRSLQPSFQSLRLWIWNTVKMKRPPTALNFRRYSQTDQLPFSNTIGTVTHDRS